MIDPQAGAASGTPGQPGDGSATPTPEELQARIAELEANDQAKDNQINQLLSEKSNVEQARREISGIRDDERFRQERMEKIREAVAMLQTGDPSEKAQAAAFLLPIYGIELTEARNEIHRLREQVRTPIPASVPDEIRDQAMEAFERGEYQTLKAAINDKLGEAVLAGKWTPPSSETKGDDKVTNGAAAATPAAPRPQPAARPVATATRSRLPESVGLPPEMTESQYLALPPGEFTQAFAARKSGKLRLTPG